MCASVWYAPVFTTVQSIVRSTERGQAVAITLILNSALGAGLGPSLVGFASDLLPQGEQGSNLQAPLIAMGGVIAAGGLLMALADVIRRRSKLAGGAAHSGAIPRSGIPDPSLGESH
jgi:hypothetical protein